MTPPRSVPRCFWLVLWVLAWVLPHPEPAHAQDVLPPSGEWVTDRAGMLSSSEAQALTQKLRAYADTTSTQIIVVTLPDLGGNDIAAYATELGQRWGVGQQGSDNGVVILVARDERKVFIATGYGLEGAIPDAVAARIIREIITPAFREGRFYAGLSDAADALMWAARGEFTADTAPPSYDRPGGGIDPGLIFVLLIIGYFLLTSFGRRGGGGGRGGGRRYRRHGGPPVIIWGGGSSGWGGGGFSSGGFGGGGFSGGGGGFGGGGAGGGW